MSAESKRELLAVISFVGAALEDDQLEALEEWLLEGHPKCDAFGPSEGEFVTFSVETDLDETLLVWCERAGGRELLAAPRR